MSRCYPFPPPGYVEREIIRNEPMIESSSIKGAKEEVKRVKNDRKHKKDKKRKERANESDISKKHRRHKRQRKDEQGVNANKKVDDGSEAEFLDKSCLTVELEHQSTSQNSCDSTLYSDERPPKQIQRQLLDCRHYDSESGIPFLLPSKEDQDPELMTMTNKDNNKRSSSQADHRESVDKEKRQEKRREHTRKLSKEKIASSLCSHPKQEKPSSSHQETIGSSKLCRKCPPSSGHQETIGSSKLCRKCPPSTAVRFLNLIENWAPDRVESKLATYSEDQEWWLLVKLGAERHHQVSNQMTIKGSGSMVWPTARFLPEVELHALPFTVPF